MDVPALVDAVLRLSVLVADHPAVREIDMDPILVYPQGVLTLDARVRLWHHGEPARAPRCFRNWEGLRATAHAGSHAVARWP